MDYRLLEFLNGPMGSHDGLEDTVSAFISASVPLFVAATLVLWLLARPGGSLRWKSACISALSSAGLGLLANQAIAHFWARPRPFTTHPATTVLAARTPDPSFPSDHATAAFAIAFAVVAFSVPVGAAFLSGATLVALSRVAGGLHYPSDVGASLLVGLAAALLVVTFAREPLERLAAGASRVTDPPVAALTRRIGAVLRPLRRSRS